MFTPSALLASSCYSVEMLPYHLLAYYPFRDRLRFPLWTVSLLVGLNMGAQFLVDCYCYSVGADVRNWDIMFAFISLSVYLSCVRAEIPKLLFIYILVVDYIMIVRGIAVFLGIQIFVQPGCDYYFLDTPQTTILRVIPALIGAPFMLAFLNMTKERVLRSQAPQLWRTIWLLPAISSFVVLAFTWNIHTDSVATLGSLLARVSLLILIFVIYYVLTTSLESLRLQGEAEERARNQERFISLQRKEYSRLQKQIEDTRQARHDLRQHLNLIQAYLDSGNQDLLKEYLSKYGSKLGSLTPKNYCANYAVNTVVRHYAELAQEHHIVFDSCVCLPETLLVDEPDICVLLGNLLENALDSCLLADQDSPFIRIHAKTAGQRALSITVDNSCGQEPVVEEGKLISSRHSGYGTGTMSIRNIASQYHGIADFKYKDGVFYASVFLNP